MNNIGFSDLEEVIYATEYKDFMKNTFFSLPQHFRRLRAIHIMEGKNPDVLPSIEKYKQQVFLNLTKRKGIE